MAPGLMEERTTMLIDIALIIAFIVLVWLMSVGLDSVLELRQINRNKRALQRAKSMRNHPSRKAV